MKSTEYEFFLFVYKNEKKGHACLAGSSSSSVQWRAGLGLARAWLWGNDVIWC